ncbi:hypothetical protein Tco_0039449, partial [Tanacetum coccineum]
VGGKVIGNCSFVVGKRWRCEVLSLVVTNDAEIELSNSALMVRWKLQIEATCGDVGVSLM